MATKRRTSSRGASPRRTIRAVDAAARKRERYKRRREGRAAIRRWAGKHMAMSAKWVVTQTWTHTGNAVARSTRHVHTNSKAWAKQKAEYGFRAVVQTCGHCGQPIATGTLHEHQCWNDDHKPTKFSGDEVRAKEPIRAYAQRLDRALAVRRANKPARRLTPAQLKAIRDAEEDARQDAIELRLWQEAGFDAVPELDEHFHPITPTTTAQVTQLPSKEVTVSTNNSIVDTIESSAIGDYGDKAVMLRELVRILQNEAEVINHLADQSKAAGLDDTISSNYVDVAGMLSDAADKLEQSADVAEALDAEAPDFAKVG